KSKEALEKKINSMWEKSITSLVSPTKLELRQVQDKIYQLRTNTALIPEWWYDTLKGDFEKSMQNTIDRYRNEAKNKNIT
ncbi:MAG: SMODS-associating effector domain, partial [Bacteroidota bacterium]